MTKVDQVEKARDGNTDTSLAKKIQGVQSKHYCFTLNNWDQEQVEQVDKAFKKICKKFIYGKEVGESGTPHLQGYIELKVKSRITQLKKINERIHWERTRNIEASIEYCKKDGDYTMYGFPDVYTGDDLPTELYEWQQDIVNIIKEKADPRKVYWYWETEGNRGKTIFSKYLVFHYGALICQKGKYSDIMNMAYNIAELKVMVIDIPRSSGNSVSYNAIESIKSGIIVNTKYETGQKLINSPHIIIFANHPPNMECLSRDRWIVQEI